MLSLLQVNIFALYLFGGHVVWPIKQFIQISVWNWLLKSCAYSCTHWNKTKFVFELQGWIIFQSLFSGTFILETSITVPSLEVVQLHHWIFEMLICTTKGQTVFEIRYKFLQIAIAPLFRAGLDTWVCRLCYKFLKNFQKRPLCL